MKKEIILSFRPEYFKPILYGLKKYEYRKRFCKESSKAFLYLSSPVKKVIGIVEFGEAIDLTKHLDEYDGASLQFKRIKGQLEDKVKNAVPINSIQLYVEPISFETLKRLNNKFTAPQCYSYVNNYPKIKDLLEISKMFDVEYSNDHNSIFYDNIGMLCSEMELTSEFKNKDSLYQSQDRYQKLLELL